MFPSLKHLKVKKSFFDYKKLYILEIIALSFLIIALMRPQFGRKQVEKSFKGYAIMIVMDNSTSMRAADLKPSRFERAKISIKDFVASRENDLLGFTIFAGESMTLLPITINHEMIIDTLDNLEMGVLKDGTAIGLGLASAIASLKESKANTRLIILLTDGNNNMGDISPEEAAQIANEFGIKIYTIGVGSRDTAPYPVQTPVGVKYVNVKVDFNEDILKQISKQTGAMYFRVTDNKRMQEVFNNINRLEKNKFKINVRINYYDKFYIPLLICFFFFVFRYLAEKFFFRMV